MFEKLITEVMTTEMKTKEVKVVNRLMGGMSNYTYVVEGDNQLFTFRIPGEFAEFFVDRKIEKENIKLFEQLNITNQTLYLNTENGIKIANYIDGISLNQVEDYPYEKIVAKLKTIHQSNLKAINDYDPFNRLKTYEKYLSDVNYIHPVEYSNLKNRFLKYQEYLESQEKVLCHGDSQPSNFVLTDNDCLVVDFEFAGNIDLIYDIACFGNMDFKSAKNLLVHYYDDELDNDKVKRLYLWRTFQCLQWFNVAVFKELHGLSEKLHIDFLKVADNYLKKADHLLEELSELKI